MYIFEEYFNIKRDILVKIELRIENNWVKYTMKVRLVR